MKVCRDSQCRRSGQLLRLSEFPLNCRKKDGHSIYCFECSRRRNSEQWLIRKARREQGAEVKSRPPRKIDEQKVMAQVLAAVRDGHRTREQIEIETRLNEEVIADALAGRWDRDQVRIAEGRYYPTKQAA